MMRRSLLVLLAALGASLVIGGCVRVQIPRDYNFNFNDGGGDDSDRDDSGGDDESRSARPDQNPGGGWTDVLRDFGAALGGHIVGAERGFVYYAFDSLAYPEKPVPLTIRLQQVDDRKILRKIEGAEIEFRREDGHLIGRARTNAEGYAAVNWTPPSKGLYRFTATVSAVPEDDYDEALEMGPTPFVVAAYDKSAEIVIVDLDHTVYDAPFWRFLLTGAGTPMKNSVAVTRRIADRYALVYLTHRPDLLTRKSKNWLDEHGYPGAPLLVAELKDAMDSGKFKTGKIRDLKKYFPKAAIGIGDKISDAQAYVDNGLTAYLIPHYDRDPDDMRDMARQISRIRDRGRLQVVSTWEQIRRGIFDEKAYPKEPYVRWLRKEADRLERRRRDDDDDDDDDEGKIRLPGGIVI